MAQMLETLYTLYYLVQCQRLKVTIEKKTSVTKHFQEINNRKQRVYCLSYCLK